MSIELLRQCIREAVRGWVDPDVSPYLDWSENIEVEKQLGVSPEDFTTSLVVARQSPQSMLQADIDCVYCAGTGVRDVGTRSVRCDICDGTGRV